MHKDLLDYATDQQTVAAVHYRNMVIERDRHMRGDLSAMSRYSFAAYHHETHSRYARQYMGIE